MPPHSAPQAEAPTFAPPSGTVMNSPPAPQYPTGPAPSTNGFVADAQKNANPFAAYGSPSGVAPTNPYGAVPPSREANPFAAAPFGGPPAEATAQYAVPPPAESYGAINAAPNSNPYAPQPDASNPFGAPQDGAATNPYSASTTDQQLNSYGAPPSDATLHASVASPYSPAAANPFGVLPPTEQANPYGTPPMDPGAAPYGQPAAATTPNHYGAPPSINPQSLEAMPYGVAPAGHVPPIEAATSPYPSDAPTFDMPAMNGAANPFGMPGQVNPAAGADSANPFGTPASQQAPHEMAGYGSQPPYGAPPPNQSLPADPSSALVPAQHQSNPYAQPQPPQPSGQLIPAAHAQVDPFAIFNTPTPVAPVLQAPPPAGPGQPPSAPAPHAGADEDFWGAFSAQPSNGTDDVAREEKKGDDGLPPGGEWYDAKIFTPTLGVMFFKPQELTDSLFLNTDKSIVDSLGERPVVAFIVEGSSARSAGVDLGHVLLKVNGIDVKNPKDASRLIKEGPRPLPLLFYVPNTEVVVAEGEHMVKYDTRDTTAPNSAKEWKPKYVVVGGIIAQPWMINMYRSKVRLGSVPLGVTHRFQ